MPDCASDMCSAHCVCGRPLDAAARVAPGAAGVAAAAVEAACAALAAGAAATGAGDVDEGEEPPEHAAATASRAARRIADDTSKGMRSARVRPSCDRLASTEENHQGVALNRTP